jgi:hypothetical protein
MNRKRQIKRDAKRQNRTRPGKAEPLGRANQALALRVAGWSFHDIARRLNYGNRSGAWHAVMSALRKERSESVARLRRLEGQRLDRLLQGIWAKATRGDVKAVLAAIRISERRSRLFGLDKPIQLEAEMSRKLPFTWEELFAMTDENRDAVYQKYLGCSLDWLANLRASAPAAAPPTPQPLGASDLESPTSGHHNGETNDHCDSIGKFDW